MREEGRVFLPYGRHAIDEADVAAVTAVLRGDWLTTGPAVEAFERAVTDVCGALHAVACASGTAALHLAYEAVGLGPGDVAVVPTITFLATANAARFLGAEVAFADVDPDTGLMRPKDVEAALDRITDGKPKVVAPVHLGGRCAAPEAIAGIAKSRALAVVEDACHALGTVYGPDGARVGACRHSDAAVFSFHPVKTVTMGEGGCITTNDPRLASRMRRMRNHGMAREPQAFVNVDLAFDGTGEPNPWYYEMHAAGFNYRASDIHCALGVSQIGKLEKFAARRRELAALYDERLAPLSDAVRPVGRALECRPVLHLYQVLIDFDELGVSRASAMGALRERGIRTQVHYQPVHLQPYYADRYGPLSLPGAEAFYRRTLSLPLFPAMDDADVDRVVAALADALGLPGGRGV